MGNQLATALQVAMVNDVVRGAGPAPITVECKEVARKPAGVKMFSFNVRWHDKRGGPRFNLRQLVQEIEKIIPNVVVTEQYVFVFASYISIEAKELGRPGTYLFNFLEVRS